MSEEDYQKMEAFAKSILRVADKEKWSESDITRQLAVLALKAAQRGAHPIRGSVAQKVSSKSKKVAKPARG